jgi:hypothetical protein
MRPLRCYWHPDLPALMRINGIPRCESCVVDALEAGVELENERATDLLKNWTAKVRARKLSAP